MSQKKGKKKLQAPKHVMGQATQRPFVFRGITVTPTPPKHEGVKITLDTAIASGQIPHNSLISMRHGRGGRIDYSNVYVRLLVAAHLVRSVLSRDEATDEIVQAIREGGNAMQEILESNKNVPEADQRWNATEEQYDAIEAALDVMDQLQSQLTRVELQNAAKGVIDSLNRMSRNQLKAKADQLLDKVFNEEDVHDPRLDGLLEGEFTVQAFPKY